MAVFFLIYVFATALSIPGAIILTLSAGFIFGNFIGLLLASFASSVGALLAFWGSRFLFQNYVESKFRSQLRTLNEGLKRQGAFYLFSLRLIPLFPFFLINILMGLTQMRAWTFYWVSQVGMLAGTFVYVNAGTRLADLESLSDIFSTELLLSFLALAALPWIGKLIIEGLTMKRIYKGFKKPKRFDYNLIVIGAGSGGLVSAYIAATLKARVALIEKNKMGGDCLNTGCVPSKALIKSAKVAQLIRTSSSYGLTSTLTEVDFKQVMARVRSVIKHIEPHDSIQRYERLGVECIQGEAQILTPWSVEVNGKILTSKSIILATGGKPLVPPLEGLDQVSYLTSENLWNLDKLPKRLVVLGGGPIGCEMAQAFARLGSRVYLVEKGTRLLSKEDERVSKRIEEQFSSEGIEVLLQHEAQSFKTANSTKILTCKNARGESTSLEFDEVLIALGRKPNSTGFGLEKLPLSLDKKGQIQHDDFMRTNIPNIFTCGDVAGPYQLTHMASHQAYYASVNALLGGATQWLPSFLQSPFRDDKTLVPWATFTDPEVATVGLTEKEALKQNLSFDLTTYEMNELDRAIADSETSGFMQVLTKKGSDKILGATIVSAHASDMITEFITAIKHSKGLNSILGTIHIYPTHSEANKALAGQWKQKRKPERLLILAKGFFKWCRS